MRSYCLAAWHEMRTHGGHTRIQTPQQRSMGKARARAYLRATVPDMILIVVHHPQNVCVYVEVEVGGGASGPLHLPT